MPPRLSLSLRPRILQDHLRALLRDHHGRRVDIARRDVRKDRRIHDPQAAHAVHPQTLVHHRGPWIGAHRARSAQVIDRARLLAEILEESFARVHLRSRRDLLDRNRPCSAGAAITLRTSSQPWITSSMSLSRRQRVDADFRRVFRAVRRNLDRSAARRPARIECQQEARIRLRFETRRVALRNPVRQRIEVELQVRLLLLRVALEESPRLVDAHRERSLARQQILQAELELAEQGAHFIVERLHVRAIVEAHAQVILQILADRGRLVNQRDAVLARAAPSSPTPDSCSSFGVSTAPADRITSRAAMNSRACAVLRDGSRRSRVGSHRTARGVARTLCSTCRFLRDIAGCRYSKLLEERWPLRVFTS